MQQPDRETGRGPGTVPLVNVAGRSHAPGPLPGAPAPQPRAGNRATAALLGDASPGPPFEGARSAVGDVQRLAGNRAATLLVQRGPRKGRSSVQDSPARQGMIEALRAEHPGLHERVASDAVDSAVRVMGAGGAGGDVVLARVTREVSVHAGRLDGPTLTSHLQEEARQRGVREVYLQVNTPGSDRTAIRAVMNQIRNGIPELNGVRVVVYTSEGRVAWRGNMRFRDTNPVATRPGGGGTGPGTGGPGPATGGGGALGGTRAGGGGGGGTRPGTTATGGTTTTGGTATTGGSTTTGGTIGPATTPGPTAATGPAPTAGVTGTGPATGGAGPGRTEPAARSRIRDARAIAQELARGEAVNRGLLAGTRLLNGYIQGRQLYDMIKLYAQARNMAAASLASPQGPFHRFIDESAQAAEQARTLADSYFAFDVFAMLPTNAEAAQLPRDHVFSAQVDAVKVEGQLREALAEAEAGLAQLRRQRASVQEQMSERVQSLMFAVTSLPYADAYLFADAGGKITSNIDAAMASMKAAINAIRLERGKAQASAKAFEITLRGEGRAGMFGDIDDRDLKEASLRRFSLY